MSKVEQDLFLDKTNNQISRLLAEFHIKFAKQNKDERYFEEDYSGVRLKNVFFRKLKTEKEIARR